MAIIGLKITGPPPNYDKRTRKEEIRSARPQRVRAAGLGEA